MLNMGGIVAGRGGMPLSLGQIAQSIELEHQQHRRFRPADWIADLVRWMHRGYTQANAGDLAAAVAFNGLVALIPTFLLTLSVAGVFFRSEGVLLSTIYASLWGLPADSAQDALDTVLTARRSSSWLGAISLVTFAWAGAGFVGCLSRSMNRIYGVPGCGYMCEKRRGFFVIFAFSVLFMVSLLASTVPTLFVAQDLPAYFQNWRLAAGWFQVLGYVIAVLPALGLFAMLYRVVPNAGQGLLDVWPGTLTAAILFILMAQVFPIYLRLLGGTNRYGAAFGMLTLMVAWFYLLAHVLLFGTYVNATWRRHRSAVQRIAIAAGSRRRR